MLYWVVREDGWIVDYTNVQLPGYSPLPEVVTQAALAAWPDLWYIDGALVAKPKPEDV